MKKLAIIGTILSVIFFILMIVGIIIKNNVMIGVSIMLILFSTIFALPYRINEGIKSQKEKNDGRENN